MLLNTIGVPVIIQIHSLDSAQAEFRQNKNSGFHPNGGIPMLWDKKVPLSNKKECSINAYNNLGKFQKHCAKYRKSNIENSMFYDCDSVYVQS